VHIRRKFAALGSAAGLICTLTLTAGIVLAANPSADLDQCANDPAPSSAADGCNTSSSQWVNGNLGPSKSNYREGDSIPYRLRFGSLSLGPHTVTIEWDTTKSGKHALDYIDDVNESVLNADPCLGVSNCPATPATTAIPGDPQVTGASITPNPGAFRLYGGTFPASGAVSTYSYPNGTAFSGDKSARVTITFTATQPNPVLAWGGHIATRIDWGATNSAVSISGSPFHTRLVNLDGSGGNQDRSLSNDAVIFPGSITIIKDAQPNSATATFPFTASPAPLANFSLKDDGVAANYTKTFSNITTFQTYTVAEGSASGWDFNSASCTVASANGGSQSVSGSTATINLKEGENVTCAFINKPTPAPSLSITKVATESGFSKVGDVIHYTITATNTGNVTLAAVTVTDSQVSNLSCSPANGSSLASGASMTCSASHAITQADIDAGSFFNQACVDDGAGGATSKCDQVTTPGSKNPHLTITKDASPTTFSSVGQVISYTIVATNDGNTTLAAVTVTDPNGSGLSCTPANGSSLAPGASLNCTASHTITQPDIDAGFYNNQACVDDGAGGAASTCDNGDVTANKNPLLSIVKTTTFVGKYDAGDTLHYNVKITNTGNVTLLNVVVSDLFVADLVCTPASPVASLAPGAEINCTASYAVQAGDLGAGKSVTNEACADDGNGDGATGAARVCDDVAVSSKNQPTIDTADKFIPQDAVTINGLTAGAGGSLYVELRINDTCGNQALQPAYSKTWSGASFTGNGTYNTDNTVAVSADATVRWCSSYSGDANNAERPLSARGEIASIDFDPSGVLSFGAGALGMLAYSLWSRRRRQRED
jgi:uncharacterized repeat protein (TIGR01451 family)